MAKPLSACLSPYRFSLTDGSVRKKSPGTLIFVFDHETVPMYHTYVLCTRERRNRERPRARDSSSSQETPHKRLLGRDSSQHETPRDERLLVATRDSLRRETPPHKRLLATRDSSQQETPRDKRLLATRLLATRDSSRRETPSVERLLAMKYFNLQI